MTPASTTSATSASTISEADRGYDDFRARVRERFLAGLAAGGNALFTTDATGLFEAYLDALPQVDRQYHTCHACRRFFETFGGLATIDQYGRSRSALWDVAADVPGYYAAADLTLASIVNKARVTGVFYSSAKVWGQPVTGSWTHMAVTPPPGIVHASPLKTAGQAAAEKLEDYKTVCRALAEFDAQVIGQVLRLLESEALYRSEKVAGPARWLRDLHAARAALKGRDRDNVLWRAVALAPAGFCHPRTSMVGTLLEDIAAGMDFAEVSRRFAAKMHPLQYQRPQAAPSAGNIAEAEKVVEKLGIKASLDRRFARLDEVTPHAIWTPAPPREPVVGNGVFGHLTPKGGGPKTADLILPVMTMTWRKFAQTVLPTASAVEYHVPASPANYAALLTAVDPDAPPILQWDSASYRNPVSWYVYSAGSPPAQWGLTPGAYRKVTAITPKPPWWGPELEESKSAHSSALAHQGEGVIFLLDGAKDSRQGGGGNGLFPEILKGELRAIRATIEAFARTAKLEGVEEASACGLMVDRGNAGGWGARFRVTTAGAAQEYRLDRWD